MSAKKGVAYRPLTTAGLPMQRFWLSSLHPTGSFGIEATGLPKHILKSQRLTAARTVLDAFGMCANSALLVGLTLKRDPLYVYAKSAVASHLALWEM